MKDLFETRISERGSAGIKLLVALVAIVLVFNAGYHYVPIAYEGSSFKQELDTAVVKGLSASGRLKPFDVMKAHVEKAAFDNDIPKDAVIEIGDASGAMQIHASYKKPVDILPFGLYRYTYAFDYTATPQGYLLKE